MSSSSPARDTLRGAEIQLEFPSVGATENILMAAVVAEGATGRQAADLGWLSTRYGWRGQVQEGVEDVHTWLAAALSGRHWSETDQAEFSTPMLKSRLR